MHVKILTKALLKKVWLAYLALRVNISVHIFEKVKQLNNDQYMYTLWPSDNASDSSAVPGFDSHVRQGFFCLFLFVVVIVCTFYV